MGRFRACRQRGRTLVLREEIFSLQVFGPCAEHFETPCAVRYKCSKSVSSSFEKLRNVTLDLEQDCYLLGRALS